MARYLTLLRFTEQGARNLSKSTTRAAAFRDAASKAGINVEAQYWTTGAYDGVLIFSAEDEKKALRALSLLATAGNVRTETLRALDAKEFEEIAGK
jgi:uncharacterized protein with GYD domain